MEVFTMSNEEKKNQQDQVEEKEQPELTGDEPSVEAEEADHKANKVDRDEAEIKSPLNDDKE